MVKKTKEELNKQFNSIMKRAKIVGVTGFLYAAAGFYSEEMRTSQKDMPARPMEQGDIMAAILGPEIDGDGKSYDFDTFRQLHKHNPEVMAKYYARQVWYVKRECAYGEVRYCKPDRRAVVQGLYDVFEPSDVYVQWRTKMADALQATMEQDPAMLEARKTWDDKLPDAREAFLGEVVAHFKDVMKRDGLDMWETVLGVEAIAGNTLASHTSYYLFAQNWSSILVDTNFLTYGGYDEVVSVIAHELWHQVQAQTGKLLGNPLAERYLHDRGIYHDVYMISQSHGALWLDGDACVKGVTVANDGYFNRPLEIDARGFQEIGTSLAKAFSVRADDGLKVAEPVVVAPIVLSEKSWKPKENDERVLEPIAPKAPKAC